MSDTALEERVEVLESQVSELSKHLKTSVVLLAKQTSNDPFRSPLELFFDGPDRVVFPNDPVGELRCVSGCVSTLDRELQAAGDDEEAKERAYDRFSVCSNRCRGFPG